MSPLSYPSEFEAGADELGYVPACAISNIYVYDSGGPAGFFQNGFCLKNFILGHPQEIHTYLLCYCRTVYLVGQNRKGEVSESKYDAAHNSAVGI